MTLFENPIQLSRHVKDLHAAVSNWQYRLRSGDIDDTGPFIGKPAITERDAFRIISEQPEPAAVKQAWSRWAFRLAEARVNAPLLAAMAHAYRVELHQIERPSPTQLTLQEFLRRTLVHPHERLMWLDHLDANTARFRSLALEQAMRRDEMARRVGLESANELTAPAIDLPAFAERMLRATDDIYRDLLSNAFPAWLDQALASSATEGWPAQLTPRATQRMLGGREWLEGLDLSPRRLPAPIAPASYARALYQLGSALWEAAIPKHELFVVGRDPYGLHGHTVGALCAQLTASAKWQCAQLSLARAQASKQARAMRISHLVAARTTALAVLLWDRSRHGAGAVGRDYEELCHHAFGFILPMGLCGVVPRLRADAGQRLVGQWLASRWNREWIDSFDEDWFRNPRGIEALRDRVSRPLPTSVEPEELSGCLDAFVVQMHELP